ncbi:MAG: GNAT family N-acetyltransferase [Melioribacteraceae bacterium]|nr:GNAT family N-acetyltransferase [Melioribacteraceae bacterium]MCF8264886.1 GNAT family N-acetyltransferase [Melioribacteraceae bacterium]MCF8413004.1 GNAT family N-acetyltransferase [Melioribacteraceae bacterium]
MDDSELKEKIVSDLSIEVLARTIFKDATEIGFKRENYLKLANLILDRAITNELNFDSFESEKVVYPIPKMKSDLPLESERIRIRDFDKVQDREIFKKWLQDEFGRYFLLTRVSPRIYNVDDLIDEESDVLGMITLNDGQPIGVMGFLDCDKMQKKAELRKLIGDPKFRGKGYGKEASRLWINYGIVKLGLTKIYLNTLETNVRNIKLNEELGFKIEGILRDECKFDNKSFDVLRMGLVVD